MLFDRTATEQMTPRDLVTHRSGLPRHNLVRYNATLSGKQILERLPYLEPSESFRNKFQYNNLMFMTAGYLIERVGGKPWEEAVRTRIFQPLGMTGCNFSVKDSQQAPDFAKPYDDRDDKIVEIPFRDITNAGPAGSINSSVSDMARWLAVQTHKGKIDGHQIISPAVLDDIHTPHMTMGVPQERKEIAPAGYALGWMVNDYRGHRRVHHGGGIDGFELAGQTVNIRLNGNSLVLDIPGQPSVTLVPDQDDSFKVKEQSELSIRFLPAEDPSGGAMLLATSDGVLTAKRKKP